jgi:hypothetical protein
MYAGVFFGLAYLIRPEAFLPAGICVVAGLISAIFVHQRRSTWIGAAALAGAFAFLAAPNVAFLTYSTGHFRIEAKGTLAYQWGQRLNQGMSYPEAANGIGPDLSSQGAFMRPYVEVLNSASFSARDGLAFMMTGAQENIAPIVHTISAGASFGSPWFFILVVFGLCRSAWDRRRAAFEGMLIATAATFVLILFVVQALWFRFFIPEFGMLLFWAGKGAEELYDWGRNTVGVVIGKSRPARIAGETIKWLSILVVVAISLRAIPSENLLAESLNWERKKAGQWLAQQEPRHKRVMDVGLQVAYYAGADLIYLPFAQADLALRYVAKRRPDFIVLIGGANGGLPYTAKWFQEGIPDKRAVLVHDQTTGTEHIKIYRWTNEASAGS